MRWYHNGLRSRVHRIADLDLGMHDDVPCRLPPKTSPSSTMVIRFAAVPGRHFRRCFTDGLCLGSALVRLAPDGTLRWQQWLDTPSKVEGVAVKGEVVWLVSDADDRAVPAKLLRATLP
ncbi:MAG: hypothetical protein IPO28_07555 [Holophagaceae bacterium]|nr:hypothetical protein [Holophagaceae bacterium]